MVDYRRNFVPGGTYFFTITLRDRSSRLLTAHIELLREAFRAVRGKRPFCIDAIVALPEHLHTIWTLPEGDDDYSGRWRAIKSVYTRAVVKSGVAVARNARGEYELWQRRYWEHTIADESDFRHHADYISNTDGRSKQRIGRIRRSTVTWSKADCRWIVPVATI